MKDSGCMGRVSPVLSTALCREEGCEGFRSGDVLLMFLSYLFLLIKCLQD